MSESERAEALKAIQLELFAIKKEYLLKSRELKRKLILIRGAGLKRCREEDCRELMPVEQFYRDDRYADSYYPYCRECCLKKSQRQYRRKLKITERAA